jgi:hypothetical protein
VPQDQLDRWDQSEQLAKVLEENRRMAVEIAKLRHLLPLS